MKASGIANCPARRLALSATVCAVLACSGRIPPPPRDVDTGLDASTDVVVTGSCAQQPVPNDSDAGVTVMFGVPHGFICGDRFMASVQLVNRTGMDVNVLDITIGSTVTRAAGGRCYGAGESSWTPDVTTVPAGTTRVVLSAQGGRFCCIGSPCSLLLLCSRRWDVTITTNVGVFRACADSDIDYGGCTVLCTPDGGT